MNNADLYMQVHTGSRVRLIPKNIWIYNGEPKIFKSNLQLQKFDGSLIKILGVFWRHFRNRYKIQKYINSCQQYWERPLNENRYPFKSSKLAILISPLVVKLQKMIGVGTLGYCLVLHKTDRELRTWVNKNIGINHKDLGWFLFRFLSFNIESIFHTLGWKILQNLT